MPLSGFHFSFQVLPPLPQYLVSPLVRWCSLFIEPLWVLLSPPQIFRSSVISMAKQTGAPVWSPTLPCMYYRLPLGLQSVLDTFPARLPAWVLSYGLQHLETGKENWSHVKVVQLAWLSRPCEQTITLDVVTVSHRRSLWCLILVKVRSLLLLLTLSKKCFLTVMCM